MTTRNRGVVILLFTLLVLPIVTTAQTTPTASDTTPSSTNQLYQEGSTESRSTRRERIRGYRQQSSGLQQKMSALPGTANPSVFIPVLFGVGVNNIYPNFGDPRSGGRTHEGEDIMAVKGTPIVSPTPAIVLRTGVGATEGNYVYTANPGGETFVYMHLDRIGEGVTSGLVLGQGSLIGYVGNTGNAIGGPAHLHFEIHNNGNAVDPFPRLTGEFSLQEKMVYLSSIFTQTPSNIALSDLLVTNFRSTFTAALAENITLPSLIVNSLLIIPATPPPGSTGGSLPPGDLSSGSSGITVVALQQYLIQAASGAAATRLKGAGATGNFGPVTEAALVEYQMAMGISPASGYYGPVTRTFIAAHPLAGVSMPPPISPAPGSSAALSRDLSQGMVGEDVRTLQRLLNAKGYTIAVSGAGSPGNESTYFGPATEAAVIQFQIANGIDPIGLVGPRTRVALGSLTSAPRVGTPIVQSNLMFRISATEVTVIGNVNPNGSPTTYWYEYGSSPALGTRNASRELGSGTISASAASYITGLSPNTTYYIRLAAENKFGISRNTAYSFQTVGIQE